MDRDEQVDAGRPRGHVPRDEVARSDAETELTRREPDQQSEH